MKKIILSLLIIFQLKTSVSQEKYFDFSIGYPINLTRHWLIKENWTNQINSKIKYFQDYKLLTIGGGLSFSSYKVNWSKDKFKFAIDNPEKRWISDISPFIDIGVNYKKNKLHAAALVNLGYSLIMSNMSLYKGIHGGLYLAPELEIKYDINKNITIGINANYNFIFSKLAFDTSNWNVYCKDVDLNVEDKIMKSFSFGLNFCLKIEK
jgi:hypothetical protein